MLLSLDNYSWAKEFLSSKALSHLEGKCGKIDFFLPKHCPFEKGIQCSYASEFGRGKGEKTTLSIEEIQEEKESTMVVEKKKSGKRRIPIVDSEVRRSPRIKQTNNGSKPTGCSDRKCLACSPSPTLSTKVIKNFGVQLSDTPRA